MTELPPMDFEHARFNMIEQQVRPWNVLDQGVLDTLSAVRREDFVPVPYRAMAFTDTEIPLNLDGLSTGETMFPPRVEARLLQALAICRHESVIEIGAGSGYMAALMASRASRVTTLELMPELAEFARDNMARNGVVNVEVVHRNGAELIDDDSMSADVVLLSGAVESIPEKLIGRVKKGGRLLAITGKLPVMQAELIEVGPNREIKRQSLFETVAQPLIGFPTSNRFEF